MSLSLIDRYRLGFKKDVCCSEVNLPPNTLGNITLRAIVVSQNTAFPT